MRIRLRFLGFFLPLLLCGPATAASWGFSDGAAPSLSYDGGSAGPAFRCMGEGTVQTTVPGGGGRFQPGRAYTVTLSIDGLAFLMTMRVEPQSGGDVFVLLRSLAESEELLAALARGKDLEVASPAGHYRLPLDGTSRAVAALRRACAG